MTATAKRVRWWRYVKERQVFCPVKHHIPANVKIPEHGFIRCPHRTTTEDGQRIACDRWVFLYAIRGGGIITAEVTPDEMDEMAELCTPAAMLEYLAIWRE